MSTVDRTAAGSLEVNTKGAPEEVLAQPSSMVDGQGAVQPLTSADRADLTEVFSRYAGQGSSVQRYRPLGNSRYC